MESNASFDKISDALGTTFKSSTSATDLNQQIEKITDKNKELSTIVSEKKDLSLKDQEFVDDCIKDALTMTKDVLSQIQTELRIGSAPRMYESFSIVAGSLNELAKSLLQSNKMRMDTDIMSGAIDEKPKDQAINIQMTSSQIMDMFDNAKKNSELNAIEAEFKIEEEDK